MPDMRALADAAIPTTSQSRTTHERILRPNRRRETKCVFISGFRNLCRESKKGGWTGIPSQPPYISSMANSEGVQAHALVDYFSANFNLGITASLSCRAPVQKPARI